MNYFDILLAKKLNGGGGGDITVESLSVTENGTYTAPQGKAYTPVTVEVAPPEDSYQLKSITTPTSLATFNASAMPMPSLKVSVEANQDLHGYDHPWAGGAGKNKWAAGETFSKDDSATYTPKVFTLAAGTYTISGLFTTTSSDNKVRFSFRTSSPVNVALEANVGRRTSATFTLTEQCETVRVYGQDNTSDTYSATYSDVMVELGSTATSFEPYSNICPISGWDAANVSDVGKNLLKVTATTTTVNGVTFTVNDDGSIDCSGTATGLATLNVAYGIPISPKYGKVILSGLANASNIIWNYVAGYDENNVELFMDNIATTANKTFNLAEYPSLTKLIVSIKRYQNTAVSGTVYPQLEIGETATTYEPYNGVTTTITLPQTVYGGELDVVNGTSGNKLKYGFRQGFTRGALDSSGKLYKLSPILDDVAMWTDTSKASEKIMSNMFEVMSLRDARTATTPSLSQHETSFYVGGYVGDEATLDALLSDLQVKYELATPTTFTTQPTPIKSLNGQNNLSVDCGDVIEGEYFIALGGE